MIAVVTTQWIVLVLYVLSILMRLPEFVRPRASQGEVPKRNLALFFFFVLIAVAMALSIPMFYTPIDQFLGGQNVANLILRFCLYGAFLLLGKRVAEAYESDVAIKAVVGPVGWIIFAAMSGLLVVFFVQSYTPYSFASLGAFEAQSSVKLYSMLGFLYPAYVAVCIIGVMFRNTMQRTIPIRYRSASVIMLIGLFGVFLLPAIQSLTFSMKELIPLQGILSYSSLGLIATSFIVLWFSARLHHHDQEEEETYENVIHLRRVQGSFPDDSPA
ncbi:hypothetical protein [Psychromicrobium lacuslunae]|uniref:Uncharacterized protein n=1 Tax=Psychromicrobium lacuslunae TaxID=1618207 RepID=A0A0D4C1C2_9MICC|nr:hypothetical protein [Psychromicrobium lacuslunae]AJT42388.1 hypothetical protein UM93_14405 [Psychromicrobium lacuslunae]